MKCRPICDDEKKPIEFSIYCKGAANGVMKAYVFLPVDISWPPVFYIQPTGKEGYILAKTQDISRLNPDMEHQSLELTLKSVDTTFVIKDDEAHRILGLGHLMAPYVGNVIKHQLPDDPLPELTTLLEEIVPPII